MDANDLTRWTRFAAKGGIGKCTAIRDCVAQNTEDLMFLQDDEIVVLMQVSSSDGLYLGFCEGVVGKFSGADVRFHGKLKKPVITRRPGSVSANASNTSSPSLSGRPIVSSPTPSDPSSTTSPFHLDKHDIDVDVHEQHEGGPSQTSHSQGHDGPAYERETFSRTHTRPSSADKSPGSDSPSVETPARPSEDHQTRNHSIEVRDESARASPDPSGFKQSLPDIAAAMRKGINNESAMELTRDDQEGSLDESSYSDSVRDPHSPVAVDSPNGFTRSPDQTEGDQSRASDELYDAKSNRRSQEDEPDSPSSEYTKEGGLMSEDSHIQRVSTVSDGGFGIGLSLLQGLADGDRDSKTWSESETDVEVSRPKRTVAPASEPSPSTSNPPTTTSINGSKPVREHRGSSASNVSSEGGHARQSNKSESDAGDENSLWDDDFLDDYRYSRYSRHSIGSKASKQSRSSNVPSLLKASKAPPLPDDSRPSLDGQTSIRSAPSPPPDSSSYLSAPRPLNIVKNTSKPSNRPHSLSTPENQHSDQVRSAGASVTPLAMAPATRQRIDEENERGVNVESAAKAEITPKASPEKLTSLLSSGTVFHHFHEDGSEADQRSQDGDERSTNGPLSPISAVGSTSSIFLPHPGAPKPVMNNGQIAARSPAIHLANAAASEGKIPPPTLPSLNDQAPNTGKEGETLSMPAVMSLISTLTMAAARARSAAAATTVYGVTQSDLLSAPGPVPISFSLENRPPSPRVAHELPRSPGFPRAQPSSPLAQSFTASDTNESGRSKTPIPRANFFPKTGAPRPRSRSFSGFSLSDADVLIPVERSREEGSLPRSEANIHQATPRSNSPSQSRTPFQAPPVRAISPSRGPARGQRPTHVPSPLSLPAINNPANSGSEPSQTIGQPQIGTPAANQRALDHRHTIQGSGRPHGLRQVASSGGLRHGGSSQAEPSSNAWQESLNAKRETSPTKLNTSQRSASHSMIPSPQNNEMEREKDPNAPSLLPAVNGASPSSSSMTRSASLRSKLSISALRAKGPTGRPSREGSDVPVPSLQRSSPDEEERVQVKDMEFELIRPTVQTSGLRVSEDAFSPQVSSPGENESVRSLKDGPNPGWRSDSPGFSPGPSHIRSPNAHSPSVDSLSHMRNAGAIQAASIEAHRMREQKWMSLISAIPSSQARKNKKVKRLLLEGVPSSVRGRVWGHVTDSRARRMDNLFPQLVKKAPRQIVPRIEQDIERDFPEHRHLRDPQGSLANLLLAYVAMVPDIRYSSGLTRIAGHLLLQAPDEDAFWTFVAVMDSHLRGYYHVNNTGQFEIDASLFRSVVESLEPELAQLLFNKARVQPIDICGLWFPCLFAGILPAEHLYRVWDILFYEGPIYLFRVALTIITLCKRPLMSMDPAKIHSGTVMELLSRPPPSFIPQDPEAFINHTFTVKIRDDDLKKQRSKREAQWKKDRLAQR